MVTKFGGQSLATKFGFVPDCSVGYTCCMVFYLLTWMIIAVFVFIRPVFFSNILTHWGPSRPVLHIMIYASVNRPALVQIMVRRLFCVKPLCHPVLTSPINQHEHISVNFYLKMQQLYFILFFFSPAAAATWLSSRGCRLRPASPGLSEKVIQRWPLQASWKIDLPIDTKVSDWCRINIYLGV